VTKIIEIGFIKTEGKGLRHTSLPEKYFDSDKKSSNLTKYNELKLHVYTR